MWPHLPTCLFLSHSHGPLNPPARVLDRPDKILSPKHQGQCQTLSTLKTIFAVHGVAKSWTRLSNWTELNTIFPGEGNGNPLQYSCLENSMDKRAWQATVHGVTKSRTSLSANTHTHTPIFGVKVTRLRMELWTRTRHEKCCRLCDL